MNIVISIHIFPNELNRYSTTLDRLNRCFSGVSDNIVLYTTLNTSSAIIDWDKSTIDKADSIKRYDELNKKILCVKKIHNVISTNKPYGVNDHRRETYKKFYAYDSIIYLDSDIVFSDQILKNYVNALNSFDHKNEWYVISPQTVRLWDTTWDCIVNERYIKHPINSHKRLNPDEVISSVASAPRTYEKSPIYKFAGGWFTAHSPKLLNFVGIPNSFGSYGPDDTFLMSCMNSIKRRGMSVVQYVVKNEIIIEDTTTDTTGLHFLTNASQQRLLGQKNFIPELREFSKKL